jgi:hypothetical protein
MAAGNMPALATASKEAQRLCPDDPMPWYYGGVAADKAYQKSEAAQQFARFKKLGGDGKSVPKGY